jgi:hypothetical protein
MIRPGACANTATTNTADAAHTWRVAVSRERRTAGRGATTCVGAGAVVVTYVQIGRCPPLVTVCADVGDDGDPTTRPGDAVTMFVLQPSLVNADTSGCRDAD